MPKLKRLSKYLSAVHIEFNFTVNTLITPTDKNKAHTEHHGTGLKKIKAIGQKEK